MVFDWQKSPERASAAKGWQFLVLSYFSCRALLVDVFHGILLLQKVLRLIGGHIDDE